MIPERGAIKTKKVSTLKDIIPLLQQTTINPNSSTTAELTILDKTKIAITANLTYNNSATAGATLNIYTSPDGKTYDTTPIFQKDITFTAGATIQETIQTEIINPHIKIEIKNNDTTYTATLNSLTVTTAP